MATLEQIETAIRNADKAGRSEDVRRLAAERQKLLQSQGGGVLQAAGETALDVAKSIPSGIRLGYEGLAGIGGDVYDMQVSGAGKLAKWLGASPETLAEIEGARGKNWLPTSADVAEKVTNPALGENYQSKTTLGRIAQTGASLLNPGTTGRNLLRTVLAPTAGIEAGREIGEQFGSEGAGALIGGLAGSLLPGGTARSIAGPRLDPQTAGHVATLQREGVPLTAGQATGRKALQHVEAGPFEGKAARLADRQATGFNRAALRRAGIQSDVADPDTMNAARDSLGAEYDNLIASNNGVPLDGVLEHELLDNVLSYERLKGTAAAPAVGVYFQRISDAAQANGGTVPADVFQSIRSDISKDIGQLMKGQGNGDTIAALRDFQDSMFDSISRNGQPEIVEAARDLNNRYRNFKIVERAMEGTSADTRKGNVTPTALAQAQRAKDRGAMVYGRGDMSDLASAGAALMKPLPNSGTAGRLLPSAIGGVAGGALMGGDLKGIATAAATAAIPWAAGGLLTSRPVRTALINQATNPMPMLDPMTAALLMRQFQQGGAQ